MATTSRKIFALAGELPRAILASTGANERNLVLNQRVMANRNAMLNMTALVGRSWHKMLV